MPTREGRADTNTGCLTNEGLESKTPQRKSFSIDKITPSSKDKFRTQEAIAIIKGLSRKGYAHYQIGSIFGVDSTAIGKIVFNIQIRLSRSLIERVLSADLSILPEPAGNHHTVNAVPHHELQKPRLSRRGD